MLCEAFKVSPSEDDVQSTPGSLVRSYPGSAVEIPNYVFDGVISQLAEFLALDRFANPHATLPSPAAPDFINALFDNVLQRLATSVPFSEPDALVSGVLRSIGRTAGISRVTKHVRDHVHALHRGFWRRSRLWLFTRVAIQMSDNPALGRSSYKSFILFFMCTLARDKSNTKLSRHLLHLMSSTILRRLNKLGSSTPNRLSEMALDTYTSLREILDARWKQLSICQSPFQNPSRGDLNRDTQLSLLNSRQYIRKALEDHDHESVHTPFRPDLRRRGTLQDFLSSNGDFFDNAYAADPDAALYDVERSVEEGIDDWVASVRNLDHACAQLAVLMGKYMRKADKSIDPEHTSIRFLTAIELCVALDKLVVKEVPMLVDYPPLISITLEHLYLRKTTSLNRLSCAVQYFSARNSQSRWTMPVLSNEFTKDSFPVRYYDQSSYLQQLKARIEEDGMKNATASDVQHGSSSLPYAHGEYLHHLPCQRLTTESTEISQSPLPTSPLHAKVVVFELQCPTCVRIWRSAVPDIQGVVNYRVHISDSSDGLFADVPALQPYLLRHQGTPSYFQIDLGYVYPDRMSSGRHPTSAELQNGPELRYVRRGQRSGSDLWKSLTSGYDFKDHCPSCRALAEYVHSTSHTSNDVMSAQANCPADLSLHEFVAIAHLRSGGSLQWLNILHGLRTRTLNLRRHQVLFLLFHAVSQVGPFDFNTGTWIWHRELQDPSFCNTLLDELEKLLMEVGASSMDSVLMNTISLLLTRVLVSSLSEDVSERAITLIRNVRRKTFSCVQDLSYDLAMAPANEERRNLLLEMAATCRNTFDVDHATLPKLLHSAEDVDALLSCSFFIRALFLACMSYSRIPCTLSAHTSTLQTSPTSTRSCSLPETVTSLLLSRRS